MLQFPQAKATIQEAARLAGQRAEAEAQTRLDTELTAERTALGKLHEERKALEQTLGARRSELAEELATLESEVGGFETRLLERIEAATTDAGDLLAQSVLLRVAGGSGQVAPTERATVSRSVFQLAVDSPVTTDVSVFDDVAHEIGLDAHVLWRLHAIVHAGLIPIVTGSGAMTALHAYAQVALAGRLAELTVTHDFLRPADLLGVRASDPATPRLHGDLLLAARRECTPERPGLVVLDGFNCGASESYLLPWLTHPRREIAVPRGAALDTDMPVHLGDGLLIAATAAVGPTTAPVHPELWGHAALLDVPTAPQCHVVLPDPTTIRVPARASAPERTRVAAAEFVQTLTAGPWGRPAIVDAATRLTESMATVAAENAERAAWTIAESLLVPSLAAGTVEPDTLATALGALSELTGIDEAQLAARLERARSFLA